MVIWGVVQNFIQGIQIAMALSYWLLRGFKNATGIEYCHVSVLHWVSTLREIAEPLFFCWHLSTLYGKAILFCGKGKLKVETQHTLIKRDEFGVFFLLVTTVCWNPYLNICCDFFLPGSEQRNQSAGCCKGDWYEIRRRTWRLHGRDRYFGILWSS